MCNVLHDPGCHRVERQADSGCHGHYVNEITATAQLRHDLTVSGW
ncbi:MAG: hypothetical protein V3R56_03630 [Xanthomonadales bacterium]